MQGEALETYPHFSPPISPDPPGSPALQAWILAGISLTASTAQLCRLGCYA